MENHNKILKDLLPCLSGNDKQERKDAGTTWYTQQKLALELSMSEIDSNLQALPAPAPVPAASQPLTRANSTAQGATAAAGAILQQAKLKPMDTPKWDGKSKTFAKFKKQWEELVHNKVVQAQEHHLLTTDALPKHILDNISTLSTTPDQIWEQLDKKYGNSKVVAKDITKELEALDHKKLKEAFMPKFAVLVEDAYSSLSTLGEIEWLTSTRGLSELEDRLPPEEKAEWAKMQTTLDGDNDFDKFRRFLKYRKQISDCVDLMGTKRLTLKPMTPPDPRQDICNYCCWTGHTEDKCRKKKKDDDEGTPGASRGSRGSVRGKGNELDLQDQVRRVRGGGRGVGRGRGYDRSTNNIDADIAPGQMTHTEVELNSNTMRAHQCNRCKMASNLPKCVACKMDNPNHCIAHCEKYTTIAVDAKVAIIKSSQSCAICLHPTHLTSACKLKDSQNYICGLAGCTSHHHPSLHGSKDPFIAKINVLCADQAHTVQKLSQGTHPPVTDWQSREEYEDGDFMDIMDSPNDNSTPAEEEHEEQEQGMEGFLAIIRKTTLLPSHIEKSGQELHHLCKDDSASLSNAERIEQLEEVKKELHKRQIEGEKVLMTTQQIQTIHGLEGTVSKLIAFFDDGSNCSVIRTELAEQMGLYGDPITLSIGTVNAKTNIDTRLYVVELLDSQGVIHMIRAFGIPEISRNIQAITIDTIKNQFSVEVQDNWNSLQRPVGKVDLLIGSEQAQLHPVHFETVGKMTVKKSIFG